MKGFKKDGKFRPTEKRTKSSLKKKDVDEWYFNHTIQPMPFQNRGIVKTRYPLLDEKRSKDTMADASSVFQNYVVKYPDSDIGRNAKNGYPNAGGDFSNALFDGDIEEAMYRADAHNLVKLHELGIESELSDVKRFEDMPSPRDEFENRYDWAKEYVKHNRNKETLVEGADHPQLKEGMNKEKWYFDIKENTWRKV